MATNPEPGIERVTRMIDMRIPMHWLLTGAIAVAGLMAGSYYRLEQLTKDMADVKVLLKSTDAQTQQFREDLAVQRFRLTSVENELQTLKARQSLR